MIMDGQGPFDDIQGNAAFTALVRKVLEDFIEALGSATDPIAQIYATAIGTAAVPVTTIDVATLTANILKTNRAAGAPTGGLSTMVAGTVTVNTTAVEATSVILLTPRASHLGQISVGTIVAGTSFVIQSSNIADVNVVGWQIINAKP